MLHDNAVPRNVGRLTKLNCNEREHGALFYDICMTEWGAKQTLPLQFPKEAASTLLYHVSGKGASTKTPEVGDNAIEAKVIDF